MEITNCNTCWLRLTNHRIISKPCGSEATRLTWSGDDSGSPGFNPARYMYMLRPPPPATHFLPLRVIIPTYLVISLSMHMTRAHGCDSHAGGGMLDYSIRGPLASSISPEFYSWTDRGGSSSRDKPVAGIYNQLFPCKSVPSVMSSLAQSREKINHIQSVAEEGKKDWDIVRIRDGGKKAGPLMMTCPFWIWNFLIF
jgi:hypothetical protein